MCSPGSLWVTDTTQTHTALATWAISTPRLLSQGREKETFPPHDAAAFLPEQLLHPRERIQHM